MKPVLLITLFAAVGCLSCRHVNPWERGKLAHPSMTTTGTPGVAEEHLYAVHEGAVGGGATGESGCGCN